MCPRSICAGILVNNMHLHCWSFNDAFPFLSPPVPPLCFIRRFLHYFPLHQAEVCTIRLIFTFVINSSQKKSDLLLLFPRKALFVCLSESFFLWGKSTPQSSPGLHAFTQHFLSRFLCYFICFQWLLLFRSITGVCARFFVFFVWV